MSRFSSLSSRVAVAVPGIGLFIAVALVDFDPLTAGFFAFIAGAAAVEAVRLLDPSAGTVPAAASALLTAGAAVAVGVLPPQLSMALLIVPGLIVSMIFLRRDGVAGSRRKAAGITGLTVLAALCFGLMARLRMDFDSPWVMFIPLLICWGGDSFAYFAGSAFGKHRMAPAVSPAKSWEGFFAGIAGSVAGALVAGAAGAGFGPWAMTVLGVVGGTAAVAGDLFESALKRDAGIKDSGALLPGHGGILDRFDSLLAVVPVIWSVLFLLQPSGML
jgi:phosphatidate cytidylyltransferase